MLFFFISCFIYDFFCSFLLLGIDDVGGSNSKVMSRSRNSFANISNSNSVKKTCLKKSVSIRLDSSLVTKVVNLEKKYVPDSISPSSVPGFTRYYS